MKPAMIQLLIATKTLRRVWIETALMGVYSYLVVRFGTDLIDDLPGHPSQVFVALSLILGLVLALRTNSAYDRWWEGRKLWGKLVNVSRNLAVKAKTIARPPADELDRFCRQIIVFAPVLRDHLRSREPTVTIPEWQEGISQPDHYPSNLVQRMYDQLIDWRQEGFLNDDQLRIIDSEIREFLEVCGGCERILKTPLAISYRIFLRQSLVVFLGALPWGLAIDFPYWTLPLVLVETYFLVGMETIAHVVEEPFGREVDDLDLDGICATIERTVSEIAKS